ncbi:MAG: 2-dehydropantoate 2-reductase [Deltaproteobacteria bacterium]|nr:2-dehydropantoate 2-reductase [Deltaproteobacteria bacterium]
MKITLVGAGAIGSLLGIKLVQSGHVVSFIVMERQVKTIQQQGLTLIMKSGSKLHIDEVIAVANPSDLGPQELIILAVKAHQLLNVAPNLEPLMDSKTAVMTVQNGLPWWYFENHGGPFDGHQLLSLDPTGAIRNAIDKSRVIGCVAYPAATLIEPAVAKHVEGDRFTIGELDGTQSERCQQIACALIGAGFKSYVIEDIRSEIWLKAWGALSFNPISALTHATMEDICRLPETRQLVREMMQEAQTVANKLGIQFRHTIEKRIDGAEKVGPHKTSMLQDIERGNSLEIEAVIGSILELAELTNTATPVIKSIYACCKLLNKTITENGNKIVALTR